MSTFEETVDAAEANVKRLSTLAISLGKAETDEKTLNTEANKLAREVEATLRKLDNDAKSAAPSARRGMQESVSSLRVSLQGARTALQKANDIRSRASLMKPDKAKAMEDASVDKLEAAARKSALNTARLQAAQAQINDTQDIGVGVVTTLTSQRETLLRATDSASNTNALAGKARGILMQMAARALTNKILLFVTVLILLGANGTIIYFIIKRN